MNAVEKNYHLKYDYYSSLEKYIVFHFNNFKENIYNSPALNFEKLKCNKINPFLYFCTLHKNLSYYNLEYKDNKIKIADSTISVEKFFDTVLSKEYKENELELLKNHYFKYNYTFNELDISLNKFSEMTYEEFEEAIDIPSKYYSELTFYDTCKAEKKNNVKAIYDHYKSIPNLYILQTKYKADKSLNSLMVIVIREKLTSWYGNDYFIEFIKGDLYSLLLALYKIYSTDVLHLNKYNVKYFSYELTIYKEKINDFKERFCFNKMNVYNLTNENIRPFLAYSALNKKIYVIYTNDKNFENDKNAYFYNGHVYNFKGDKNYIFLPYIVKIILNTNPFNTKIDFFNELFYFSRVNSENQCNLIIYNYDYIVENTNCYLEESLNSLSKYSNF